MTLLTKEIKILFVISLLYFFSNNAFCCDMSAFVQSEFADRCQRLINFVEKAYISVAVEHPDSDKKLSEVSKDWIDFYLSHGNRTVQPPNMNFISPDIWERNIKDLGYKFGQFLHKKMDAKTYQTIILNLTLFKNEEQLSQLHNSFKAANTSEKDLSKIENIESWIDIKLLIPYNLIYAYEKDYSELASDLNATVEEHLDSFKRLREFVENKDKSNETKQFYFDMINEDIDKTLDKWEKRYYFR